MIHRLLLAFGLLVARPHAQDEPYVITDFQVDITLDSHRSMRVVERIDVEFNAERRGIFRHIPVEYETGRGTVRKLHFDLASVTDGEGRRQPHVLSRQGTDVNIRIGDPDVYLPPGTRRTYVIEYKVSGMLNWFDASGDWEPSVELYWNATGDSWDTYIERSSVSLSFPDAGDPGQRRLRVFAGSYGSRNSDTVSGSADAVRGAETGTVMSLGTGRGLVVRAVPLRPYEGLTIVLGLPAAAVPPPSRLENLFELVRANMGLSIFAWVLGGMLAVWWRRGRDLPTGPIVVQYEPPPEVSAAEAGTLLDEKVNDSDLSAAIVALAVKGYLEFHSEVKSALFRTREVTLKLTDKAPDSDLSRLEREVHRRLAAIGTVIGEDDLRDDFAPKVGELRAKLYEDLVSHGFYSASPETTRNIALFAGLAGIVVLGAVFTLLSPFRNPLPAVIGGVLALPGVIFISRAMPQRTPAGAKAHAHVIGFEEFIRRAKSPELKWQTQVEPTEALFERLLPYAVAFGLVTEWTEAFAPILMAPPAWYHGDGGFGPRTFSSDLNSTTRRIASAATTPPRSAGASGGGSGFGGGGGFSGGGFGGGGGGSW